MNMNSKNKNNIFLNSIFALSLLANAVGPAVLAQEEKAVSVPDDGQSAESKEPESKDAEAKEESVEQEETKSKSIESLKKSFIDYDLSTAFGILPGILISVSKEAYKEEVLKKEPESIDSEAKESNEPAKERKEKPKSTKPEKKKPKKKRNSKSKASKPPKELSEEEKAAKELEQAQILENQKKEKRAAFEKSKNKKLARCLVYAGYLFLLDTNAKAARNCFLTATILNPESEIAKCYLSKSLAKLAKFDEQNKLLEELERLEDKSAFAYLTLAEHQLRLKNTNKAMELIDKALNVPDEKMNCKPQLLMAKARCFAQMGLGKKTIEAYEVAAEETENKYMAQILLANSKLIAGDLKGSKEHIVNASKILPDDPIWQYKLGNYYLGENNNTKATEYLLASTVTNRFNPKAYYNLANQYSYSGEFNNALSAIQHVQKLIPYSSVVFAAEGDIQKRKGNIKNAIEAYDEAIKIDPTVGRVYYELSSLYSVSKRKDKAVETFESAIKMMPNYWRVRFNFAEILWQLKMYDQAKVQCVKGISLLPEPTEELNVLAKHYLSRANAMLGYLSNKNKDKETTIEKAILFNKLKFLPVLPQALRYIKLRPERLVFSEDKSEKDPLVQVALADMFYELKDYKTSEKHYRKAIELSPDDADLHSYLLNVLTHKNDWAGAAQENFIYSGKIVNRLPGKLGEWLSPKDKQ